MPVSSIHRQFVPLLIVGLLLAFGGSPAFAQQSKPAAPPLSPAERQSIEGVVRDFLLKNPEVIVEAIQNMREREQRDTEERAKANLVKYRSELLNDPDTPVGANVKGDVTLVEFFDYRCGFCKRVFPDLMKILNTDKNIRYVFKEFPILGPDSMTASKAALAAWFMDKTKYQAFHQAMMGSKGGLPESRVMDFAAKVGYDVKALKKAMNDPKIDDLIAKNFELAKALDINGTPAFVIGDEVIRGAVDLETLRGVISRARGS